MIDTNGKEEEGVGVGLSRDLYATFWKDVADSLMIGEDERVPFVRHDLFTKEWEAVGKILVKGFLDTNYFPVVLGNVFMQYVLFNTVLEDDLLHSFLRYLSLDERRCLVEKLLATETDEHFSSDDVFEFLEQFKVRSRLTVQNVRATLIELARQELIQKPHIMISCWRNCCNQLKKSPQFSSPDALKQMYENVIPTTKKVLALFTGELPKNEAEADALKFFKRFVRGLNEDLLKKLLQFLTGSDIIIVKSIEITFYLPDSDFKRRPIARTCAPLIELPSSYNSFPELREEFINILKDGSWSVDYY